MFGSTALNGNLTSTGTASFVSQNDGSIFSAKKLPVTGPFGSGDLQALDMTVVDDSIYMMHSQNFAPQGSSDVVETNAIRMTGDTVSINAPPVVNLSTTHYPKFSVNTTTGAATFNNAYTLPSEDGGAGESLQTDGNGQVSWATVGGGGGGSEALLLME